MRSLSVKITLAFLLVSLAGTALAAFFLLSRTRTAFDRFLIDQDKNNLVAYLENYYRVHANWEGVGDVFARAQRPNQGAYPPLRLEGARLPFALVDETGRVVWGRGDGIHQPVNPRRLEKAQPIMAQGQVVGWLMEAPIQREPNSPEGIFLTNVRQAILYSALGATALALILGGFLARSLTRPLRELAGATEKVARGELGTQVEVHSQDEMGQLAGSFNRMSADLAHANQLRKQMTADIAHELRGPLSVMLGYTEALSEGKISGDPEIYSIMHQESQQLNHLIEDLRTLSLAEAGEISLVLQETSPRELLQRVAASFTGQAQEKDVSIRIFAGDGLPEMLVDPERMVQVLANLVANALRYVPDGGTIELSAQQEGSDLNIRVQDNGPGIAPEDMPYIFERLYRGDKARQNNGESGLGLAIARSLVEAHGGVIQAENVSEGGARLTIQLPLRS